MRFLHTSDWHLGKIFHEISFLEDQAYFLNQIIDELKNAQNKDDSYDALFVSGDIYDRAVPSAEAVVLFSNFISKVHNLFPSLEMFFIAGNHDSASRLSFAKEILKNQKIHICTNTEDFISPVIIKNKTESVAIYSLPFLTPYSIKSSIKKEDSSNLEFDFEDNALKTQQDLYKEACFQIIENHKKNHSESIPILLAHLFTLNSIVSDSERSFVGTAEQVDASLFDEFYYTALGHLHGFQVCGKNKSVYYSGSPLQYSFGDKEETFILSVKTSIKEKAFIEKIPIKPLHKLVRLEGSFSDFCGNNIKKELIEENKNNYVEIICTDSVMPVSPMPLLRSKFPLIMSFVQKSTDFNKANQTIKERKEAIDSNNPEKIFDNFIFELYADNKDIELTKKEKELFIEESKNYEWENNK